MENRYTDPTLVECDDCHWIGKVYECYHGYKSSPVYGAGSKQTDWDVEPMDYCPKCGSDRLMEIQGDTSDLTPCPV